MILGRNSGLWAALIQAAINVGVAVVVVDTGHPLTPDVVALFAALNALGLAAVGVIANSSDTGTVPTFALSTGGGQGAAGLLAGMTMSTTGSDSRGPVIDSSTTSYGAPLSAPGSDPTAGTAPDSTPDTTAAAGG